MYRAVIFDVDGTLIDTREVTLECLRELIIKWSGKDVPVERLTPFFSMASVDAVEMLGLPEPEIRALEWVDMVAGRQDEMGLFHGVKELLDLLKSDGVPMALATSRSRLELEHGFAAYGLEGYFAFAVTADDVEKSKPDPEPLLLCAQRLERPPEQCLYIGDMPGDLAAAKAAGMDFGLALWGTDAKAGFEQADYHFESPSVVIQLWERLFNKRDK